MSEPREQAKKRFLLLSILLVGIASLPVLWTVLAVQAAPRVGWSLLGLWAIIVFFISFLQMRALVRWLNPPEPPEKDK